LAMAPRSPLAKAAAIVPAEPCTFILTWAAKRRCVDANHASSPLGASRISIGPKAVPDAPKPLNHDGRAKS
jgi:hypothetical protein